MYVPNITVSNYMRQKWKELKRKIDEPTIIVRGFSTPDSVMGRSVRQHINEDIQDFNNIINQLDIVTLLNNKRMHIFLNLAWIIHPDILHSGLQNTP